MKNDVSKPKWFLNFNFAAYWFSQSTSQLGDAVAEVVLPVWAGILTESPGHVAGVAAAEMLPALVIGPLAGVIADRWNPKILMIVCDILRSILILSLLFTPKDFIIWQIYFVSFGVSLLTSFAYPARNIVITSIVRSDLLARAVTLSRASESIALMAGPVIGSVVLLRFGINWGIVLDAITFVVSAIAISIMNVPLGDKRIFSNASHTLRRIWIELVEGVRYALSNNELITLLAVNSVVHLVGTLWFSVDIFFVEQSLGSPKESVGVLWAFHGAGGLIGSFAAISQKIAKSQKFLLIIGLIMRGGAILIYALLNSYVIAIPIVFFAGFGGAFITIALSSLILLKSPQKMIGRVTALSSAASQFITLFAIALISALSTFIAPWQTLLGCGALLCFIAGWLVAKAFRVIKRPDFP